METKDALIQSLLERVEKYGKTSIELIKLKVIDKAAETSAALLSKLLIVAAILMFALFLNFAIALWLGDILGKAYYGFLIVAAVNGVVSAFLFSKKNAIKKRINNSIIAEMFN